MFYCACVLHPPSDCMILHVVFAIVRTVSNSSKRMVFLFSSCFHKKDNEKDIWFCKIT